MSTSNLPVTKKMVSSKSPSRRQQLKAKRPYSDYNVFYRLERMRILQSSGTKIDDATAATLAPADHCDPFEHPRPQNYVDIRLPPYWYSSYINGKAENVGGGPKRKHRKCPGRLSMGTLSKMISKSWRNADLETKAYCKMLAKTDALLFGKRTRSNQVSKGAETKNTSSSTTKKNGGSSKHLQPVQFDAKSKLMAKHEMVSFPQTGIDVLLLEKSYEECREIQPITGYGSFIPKMPVSDAISLMLALENPMPEVSSGPELHLTRYELVDVNHDYSVRAEIATRVRYPSNLCHPCSNNNISSESETHFKR